MKTPLISIIHPTARLVGSEAFPEGWREACRVWHARAADPSRIEYLIGVHEARWKDLLSEHVDAVPQWAAFHAVKNTARPIAIDGAAACWRVARGKLICIANDDLFPPDDWDELLIDALAGNLDRSAIIQCRQGFPGPDGLMEPAFQDLIFVPQIFTRKRQEDLGYFCPPDYISMYSDQEYTEHAKLDGVVVDARHIVFEHRHFIYGNPKDEIYADENAKEAYEVGLRTLNRRQCLGFPDPDGKPCKLHSKPACRDGIAWCTPGFSFDWRVHHANKLMAVHLASKYELTMVDRVCSNQYIVRDLTTWDLRKFVEQTGKIVKYVLWTDSDNVLTPQGLDLLVDVLDNVPHVSVVGGWYYIDVEPPRVCAANFVEGKEVWLTFDEIQAALDNLKLIEINAHMGFGAILMRAEVLETAGGYAFSPIVDQETGQYLGDDVSFCRRAMARGYRFFVHPEVHLPHLKTNPVAGPLPKIPDRGERDESRLPVFEENPAPRGNGVRRLLERVLVSR